VYQLLIWEAGPTALVLLLMGLLLVWRHSANIQKLLAGTESKIGHRAGKPGSQPAEAAAHKHGRHGKHNSKRIPK
jgi:acyl phosphate:glycerol-3-phosphate acyltransferase